MKKLIFDGQEYSSFISANSKDAIIDTRFMEIVSRIGLYLSHDMFENSEIEDNESPIEMVEQWLDVYFEDLNNKAYNYRVYRLSTEFIDDKLIQNYICEIDYIIMGIDDIFHSYKPIVEFKSKIKFHTVNTYIYNKLANHI